MERQLGGLERQFHLQNLVGTTHMCGTLRFQGRFDELRLRQAFKEISQVYPLLRASIVADPFIRFSMKAAPAEIGTSYLRREDEEHWRRVVEQELIRKYNPGEGLSFFHVLTGDDHFDIILSVNHSVVDALTVGAIFRNLVRLYNGEAVDIPALQKPMEKRFPWFFKGIIGWLLTFRFIWSLIKLGPSLQIGGMEPTQNTRSEGFVFDRSLELNRLAKTKGTNLFGVICAVTLKSVYEIYGEKPSEAISLNTPVSLRQGIGASDEEFGVFLAGHLANYQISESTDTWSLAKDCLDRVHKGFKAGNPFLLAKLARGSRTIKYPKVEASRSDRRPTINVSNVGKAPLFPRMGEAVVTEHRAAAAQSIKDPFAFAIVSYEGKTFFDLQSSREKMTGEESRRLLETVQKNLNALLPQNVSA